jgi:hypothetical protein
MARDSAISVNLSTCRRIAEKTALTLISKYFSTPFPGYNCHKNLTMHGYLKVQPCQLKDSRSSYYQLKKTAE